MCGVAGFFRPDGLLPTSPDALVRMTQCLSHRGPDAQGIWVDNEAGVALGHRRLSILELSDAGAQPMQSHSGRYVLATNGEIYNHQEIRDSLEREGHAPAWRGHSDTESLLAAIDRWGVDAALCKTVGMFAFALWDRFERRLSLARDRLGEKPMYYSRQGDTILFASELKSLRMHPAFNANVDREQLAIYLQRGYVPAPNSIYGGVHKLPPGCIVHFGRNSASGAIQTPAHYWSLGAVAARGLQRPFDGTDQEALDGLEYVLARAVSLQCVADVPLGAFLSGGVDSSTIVAIMQSQSSRAVRTFAIGFAEDAYDESGYARAVANRLGTDHTELIITPQDAVAVISRLPRLYDEPLGDSSAIPTCFVSELARNHVSVSLSGDGGDELFGGYTRYWRAHGLWKLLRQFPYPLRAAIAGESTRRNRRILGAQSPAAVYDSVMLDQSSNGMVRGTANTTSAATVGLDEAFAESDFFQAMMLADGSTYLPDNILVKLDRASMGASLESRVPMLDHRVVEFAWTLPRSLKYRDGQGKWLLRALLRKFIPDAAHDRRKKGFSVPVGQWLRGELRDWAEDLLAKDRLAREGFLDGSRVRALWSEHLRGRTRSGEGIWRVLVFQSWLAEADRP